MKTKHTPGPWHAHFVTAIAEQSDGEFTTATGITNNSESEFQRAGNRGDLVAWLPHDTDHEANARLIAAAPELLAALTLIVNDPECRRAMRSDQISNAGAAIAKAKGEA